MKYTTLPETLTINNIDYQLNNHFSSEFNWWSFAYLPINEDTDGLPPTVMSSKNSKKFYQFLCSVKETKEETYNDLLERLNSMIDD